MDKTELRGMIEWMESKGHSEEEIMDCIRKMVGAKPKKEPKKTTKRK